MILGQKLSMPRVRELEGTNRPWDHHHKSMASIGVDEQVRMIGEKSVVSKMESR